MTKATRAGGAIAAVCLLAATACGSEGDEATSESAATAAPATAVEDASAEPATTEPPETTPSTATPTTVPPAKTRWPPMQRAWPGISLSSRGHSCTTLRWVSARRA